MSVGSASNVWGVGANDEVYRWDGSALNQIAGGLKQISVGSDGEVWGVNGSEQVYSWNGNNWDLIEGWFEDVSLLLLQVLSGLLKAMD